MAKSSYWCFTLNNYTDEEEKYFGELIANRTHVTYGVFGREVGDNGTMHLQGYIEFANRKTIAGLKKLNRRVHWEKRKGTGLQAANYCKKENDFIESGELSNPQPGKRTDIEAAAEILANGGTVKRVAEEHPVTFIKYFKGIERLHSVLNDKPRNWKTPKEVIVFYGLTGTGKTRKVYEETEEELGEGMVWTYPGNNWFDGWERGMNALFDEMTGSEFKLGYLLRVLDRYPMQVGVKCSHKQWNPDKIYLTSNFHPREWYHMNDTRSIDALLRRITRLEEIV